MSERLMEPLWSIVPTTKPVTASELVCERCPIETARILNEAWHSRLPQTQTGPWQFAFAAHSQGYIYAVALWHNPSARMLPAHWLELRRMAVADDAPHCTASWFLGRMGKWFKRNEPDRERMISYQDIDVHKGTIYKAAGWTATYHAKARVRDRSKPRVGTRRDYRNNLNGSSPDGAGKTRWEKML